MSKAGSLEVSDAVRAAFRPIQDALGSVRQAVSGTPDVVLVRPGYDYPARGAPTPAAVVAVTPGTRPVDAAALSAQFKIPVAVVDASVEEQIAQADQAPVSFGLPGGSTASAFETLLGDEAQLAFQPPKSGSYEEPEPPNLPLVKERMQLTICVSPEAGWSELKTFLAGTKSSLVVAMYQFTAPHIFQAIEKAVESAGRTFELVLHPVPEKPAKSGVKAHDLDEENQILTPLKAAMHQRFTMAWATLLSREHPDGLWASAYHIKVAVRDGKAVWLSSGNWQSSNQPAIDMFGKKPERPPAGFQRKYNRDYHAIAVSQTLASIYAFYIDRDLKLASAQAAQTRGAPAPTAAPDLFVPDDEDEDEISFAAPPRFFPPLRLDRVVSVQPLLTPDNYAEHALKLIGSATKSVWFQNQYINFRGTNEDFNEFRLLISALKEKIDAGLDVRIICRDMMKQESLDVLIALGFPKEVFRFQPACHNKTIIVDGRVVMFGSHNWSNEGVKTNRDASLIFDDKEIAAYLADVYDYDWERLATAHPTQSRPRLAKPGESAPKGMKRVSFTAVYED